MVLNIVRRLITCVQRFLELTLVSRFTFLALNTHYVHSLLFLHMYLVPYNLYQFIELLYILLNMLYILKN